MSEKQEPWRITIQACENGYVTVDQDGEMTAFEEREDCPLPTDPRCMARLLWHIVEFFGGTGSKHDSERISISVTNPDGEEIEEK